MIYAIRSLLLLFLFLVHSQTVAAEVLRCVDGSGRVAFANGGTCPNGYKSINPVVKSEEQAPANIPGGISGKVISVIDGDTIDILHNGQPLRIRLNGIDCPEKGQAHGNKAKQFVQGIAGQKMVTVEVVDTDKYGRSVGDVFLPDGRNLNREIVSAGYAWWFRKYSNDSSLGGLENRAREARRGLWQDNNPQAPWDWRAEQRSGASAVGTATTGGNYHGNTSSRVFHASTCKHFGCKNCTAAFGSRDEAIAAGYKPCGWCKP